MNQLGPITTKTATEEDPLLVWQHRQEEERHATSIPERSARIINTILFLLPVVWMCGQFFPPMNHDAAVVLDITHRWFSGARLYYDIIDINTPFVFLVYGIPDLLSRVSGINAVHWLTVCLIGGVMLSYAVSRRILLLMPVTRQPLTSTLLPAAILFVLAVFPNDMFGQREHIMLIATVPYILLSAVRANNMHTKPGTTIAITIVAGIGFAMKPHFLAMPFLIELYLLFWRGWRQELVDPVPWILAGVVAVHVAVILFITPDYINFTLPLAFSYYQQLGDQEWYQVLMGSLLGPTMLALIPLGGVALFVLRSRLAIVLMLYTLGAVASAVVQAKGWPYHALPALSATLLLAAVILAKMTDRYLPLDRKDQRLPVAVISATFMALFYYQSALFNPPFQNQRAYSTSIAARLLEVVQREAFNHKVLVLSPGIYPHYPVLNYASANMTMRFESMWLLQGIYSDCDEFAPLYNAPENMSAAENFIFHTVPEDFRKQKPALLIVDRVAGIPRCQAGTFDYLDYFSRNPLFAKAMKRYQPFMDLDRYTIYKLDQQPAATDAPKPRS